MTDAKTVAYRTRFAPSPTGPLHLGHAYSALTAADLARQAGGAFLLRIEDIDRQRSKPKWETQIFDDLHWLGLTWPEPVMRQSDRLPAYRDALNQLFALGLCYPCTCSRADIRAAMSAPQEGVTGPDGPIYPGTCRVRCNSYESHMEIIRLNIGAAMDYLTQNPTFTELGPVHPGTHVLTREMAINQIGDIVLARRDMGTSYHLSVVVDDAAQGITHIVRGADLFQASFIHILLQNLLELPIPSYWHHTLIRDVHGKRLAKRDDARAVAKYRADGLTPDDIRGLIGLTPSAS